MADNEASREDKQHEASARKLQEAAREGRVPRSRDVGHALLLAAGIGGLTFVGPSIAHRGLEIIQDSLRFNAQSLSEPARMASHMQSLAGAALSGVVPLLAVLAVAGIAAGLLPGGIVFSTTPIAPDFNRLNPGNGLSRIVSRDGLVDLVKLLAIVVALGFTAWQFAGGSLEFFSGLASLPLDRSLGMGIDRVRGGWSALTGVVVVVALVDGPLQWFRHRANLRMTLQEMKDEHKQTEGDPRLKGRIRARQREVARARMMAAVPSASVVVMNPTHYAVALRYDEGAMGAPRVVAKGVDLVALHIRDLAKDHGVPVLTAPPLARALYANVEIEREIPAALYGAVAQVLAWVYQLKQHVPGRGRMPQEPSHLDVPQGMDPHEGVVL
jgi:flagellar biosynthesis protein FlhB